MHWIFVVAAERAHAAAYSSSENIIDNVLQTSFGTYVTDANDRPTTVNFNA